MDIFLLINNWFEFCKNNPEKVNSGHSALYFYLIYLNNSLNWKEKFGLPTYHAMEVLGISNYKTYKKTFDFLVENRFIKVFEISKNQFTSTIIGLVKNTKASPKHVPKQVQSTVVIDIPINTIYNNNVRVEKFVELVNSTFSRKFKVTQKVIGQFKARIGTGKDQYSPIEIKSVIDNLKLSTWHIDSNFSYCTPEFILRESTIERYKHGPSIQKPKPTESIEPAKNQKYAEETNLYSEFD